MRKEKILILVALILRDARLVIGFRGEERTER